MAATPGRIDGVDASGSRRPINDQPGLLEQLEVLRDGWPAHRQPVRELAHGSRVRDEPLEDGASGWIPEGLQRLTASVLVSRH